MAIENKRLSVPLLDVKTSGLGARQFEGYGACYTLDRGNDRIMRGSFQKSLDTYASEGRLPPMLWSHDLSRVCGKWLSMTEDANGLRVKGEFSKTPLGDEVHELVKSGAVSGLSIGFLAREVDWSKDGTRLLKEIDLLELSLVSVPMNNDARVSASKDALTDVRHWEHHLRELGLSKRQAVRVASKSWSAIAVELDMDPEQVLKDLSSELQEQQAIAALLASANRIKGY